MRWGVSGTAPLAVKVDVVILAMVHVKELVMRIACKVIALIPVLVDVKDYVSAVLIINI